MSSNQEPATAKKLVACSGDGEEQLQWSHIMMGQFSVMMWLSEMDPYLGLSSDIRLLLDARKAVIIWPEKHFLTSWSQKAPGHKV